MKQEIIAATKKLGAKVAENSPAILTTLGIVGIGVTVVLAVKGTVKALQKLDETVEHIDVTDSVNLRTEVKDLPTVLTKKETVKTVWKCYIPTVTAGTASIACILWANKITGKRAAALASLASIYETTLKGYESKIVEVVGEKKATEIKDEVRKEAVKKNPPKENNIEYTGRGNSLCYDAFIGRYFYSDIEAIRKSVNDIREMLFSSMWVDLNEFYYSLGLERVGCGDILGWNIDRPIEIEFTSMLTDEDSPYGNGVPCLIMDFRVGPRYDFKHLY